jgi:predicted nucleic acid-binding protein
MTHLLDTSAFLIYYFGEPGSARLTTLLGRQDTSVALCAVSATEFWARLKAEGFEDSFASEWTTYRKLFELSAVNEQVALKATELREAATQRISTVDSLIAGCAALHNAVLLHRDPHFQSIPENLLKQEFIG